MSKDPSDFGLDRLFAPSATKSLIVQEEKSPGGEDYLIVTEVDGEEGGQHLFQVVPGGVPEYIASDTVILLDDILNPRPAGKRIPGVCSASAGDDHAKMHTRAKEAVGVFKSNDGPDNGNLACVWAVRHLAEDCLGREIHRSDSTTKFGQDLRACQLDDLEETDIPAGGIIISPTAREVGHVGILGEGSGKSRLIYSNSSSRAEWQQNFTLGKWIDRYKRQKGLEVLFFHLPRYTTGPTV